MLSPTAATAAASASAELVPKHTYHAFMAKMQQPSASGLFRSIKLFVRDLLSDTQRSVDEVAEAVQAFLYETEEAIAQHPLWHGCEPEELEKACDALEKFVTTKLYDKVFLTDAEEIESDRLLEERLQHLRFVTVEHLSVSPAFCTAYPWASACADMYWGPPHCPCGATRTSLLHAVHTEGTGQLAPGGHCCTYAVRVPASGVLCVPRDVTPQASAQQELCKMAAPRGQTQHASSWQRRGWPPRRLEAPSRSRTVALWAPQLSHGGSGPAAPPRSAEERRSL